ncbi:MAG: DUF3786 domain-containing protein [Desulfobacterales bacterium]|nr:MAG: DUF3786 domain-containing protein [Desulfobacterales bacterium]
MKKSAVFEETYDKYLSQISNVSLMSRAVKLGAEMTGDALIVPYYRRPFQISSDGVFDETGKRAGFSTSVVLFQYIFHCPAEIPSIGDWVTFRDFKDAGPLGSYFISNNNKIIDTKFAGNPKALQQACIRFGGQLLDDDPSWDLSAAFDMLPRIPIRLRFNDKDDEFPAQSSILFRQSAESYIDMESLAMGATYLTGMLTKG